MHLPVGAAVAVGAAEDFVDEGRFDGVQEFVVEVVDVGFVGDAVAGPIAGGE